LTQVKVAGGILSFNEAMRAGSIPTDVQRAPRYTSYPAAPHFHAGVDADTYRKWLSELSPGTPVSLYLHIPFCDSLCWFCGCHTKATRSYAPVAKYLRALQEEIGLVVSALPRGVAVQRIHWGGGSPTILSAEDISFLASAVRSAFTIAAEGEFSVEIDPRNLSPAQIKALLDAGLTRASFGVQDFNPKVQSAINRIQSFALTRAVIDAFRLGGVSSINVDVLYGLPHQSVDVLVETLLKVLLLEPDRVALFGYAHVPWLKKHQAMIDEASLPDPSERLREAEIGAELLSTWGYQRVGIDHFAKPGDSLASAAREGRLRRNFQGYTDDQSEVLLGLGASAISRLPQGYVQNAVATPEYERLAGTARLPVARGYALESTDRARGYAIERLMCEFRLSRGELRRRYGELAESILKDIDTVIAGDHHHLLAHDGETIRLTERGRPFVRSICAALDPFFSGGTARHSLAV
jgi:oxygen-independent coproporphyrinogen III oxidase